MSSVFSLDYAEEKFLSIGRLLSDIDDVPLCSVVHLPSVVKLHFYEGMPQMVYPYQVVFWSSPSEVLATWSFTEDQKHMYERVKMMLFR